MSKSYSPPLSQAQLLRSLEYAWMGVAAVAMVVVTVNLTLHINGTVEQTRVVRTHAAVMLAQRQRATDQDNTASSALPATMPPAGSNFSSALGPAPAPVTPTPGGAATYVMSGSTASGAGSAAGGIESKLGAWLTLDQCQPDLPIYANVRGQWREASIVDVRRPMILVRFADSSFSDEECSISQIRARAATGPSASGAIAAGTASKASGEYQSGDWVEVYDAKFKAWRTAAIVSVTPQAIITRYFDELQSDASNSPSTVRPWNYKSDPRYSSRTTPPEKAPINLKASDFIPGEEVVVVGSSPFSKARVVGADGDRVVIRWHAQLKPDESFAPDQIRLSAWGPFQERTRPSATDIPVSTSRVAAAKPLSAYAVGEQVDIIFRGRWSQGQVVSAQDDNVFVDVNMIGVRVPAKVGEIRAASGGQARAEVQPQAPTGPTSPNPDFAVVAFYHYRNEDPVQTLTSDGQWVPAKVKRTETGRIILYPLDGTGSELSRAPSQVRMKRELFMQRVKEASSVRPPVPGGQGQQPAVTTVSSPERRKQVSDYIPGLLVFTSRNPGAAPSEARVVRVDGDNVVIRYKNDNSEDVKDFKQLTTTHSLRTKAASLYKPGEWVYARMSPNPSSSSWYARRIEKIEDGKIILMWGWSGDMALEGRTKSVEDVRPMKMANE